MLAPNQYMPSTRAGQGSNILLRTKTLSHTHQHNTQLTSCTKHARGRTTTATSHQQAGHVQGHAGGAAAVALNLQHCGFPGVIPHPSTNHSPPQSLPRSAEPSHPGRQAVIITAQMTVITGGLQEPGCVMRAAWDRVFEVAVIAVGLGSTAQCTVQVKHTHTRDALCECSPHHPNLPFLLITFLFVHTNLTPVAAGQPCSCSWLSSAWGPAQITSPAAVAALSPALLLLLLLAILLAAIWLASSRKFARQLGRAFGFRGLQEPPCCCCCVDAAGSSRLEHAQLLLRLTLHTSTAAAATAEAVLQVVVPLTQGVATPQRCCCCCRPDAVSALLVVLALTAMQLTAPRGAAAAAYLAASIALVRRTGCGGGGGIDCTSCSARCCCCCGLLQDASGTAAAGVAAAAAVAAVATESLLLAGTATRLLALPLLCSCTGVIDVTCMGRFMPAAGVPLLLCCCFG